MTSTTHVDTHHRHVGGLNRNLLKKLNPRARRHFSCPCSSRKNNARLKQITKLQSSTYDELKLKQAKSNTRPGRHATRHDHTYGTLHSDYKRANLRPNSSSGARKINDIKPTSQVEIRNSTMKETSCFGSQTMSHAL